LGIKKDAMASFFICCLIIISPQEVNANLTKAQKDKIKKAKLLAF